MTAEIIAFPSPKSPTARDEARAQDLLVQIGRGMAELSDVLPDTWCYRLGAVMRAVEMSCRRDAG